MTAIPGAAAAVTGAASGIGRALALELAARGCGSGARRPRRGRPAVGRRRDRQRRQRKVTTHRVDVGEPDADRGLRAGRHRGPSLAQHRHQQCRRGPARPVHRDRPGADGMADQHQFLGRGACDPRLPAASFDAAARRISSTCPRSSASSPRPARPPIARVEIRGARLFGKPAARAGRWRTARCGCRWCIPAASPPTSRAIPAPAAASPTMRAAPNRSTASTRWRKKTPAAAALRIIAGHREEPAAHPDRQRRALHGPAATLPTRDLLGGAGAPAREAQSARRGDVKRDRGSGDAIRVARMRRRCQAPRCPPSSRSSMARNGRHGASRLCAPDELIDAHRPTS